MDARSKTLGAAEAGSSQEAGGSKRPGSELDTSESPSLAKKVAKSDGTTEHPEKEYQPTNKERRALRKAKNLEKLKDEQQDNTKQAAGYTTDSSEEEKDESVEEELMSKSDVESRDVQDSDHEPLEVVQDSVQEAAVELNDYCLLHVFSFLNGKERTSVQRVSRQWKRVSEEFSVLKAQEFCVPCHTSGKKCTVLYEHQPRDTNWPAFLRAVTRAGSSLLELDISGVLPHHYLFSELIDVIDEGACSGVQRVVVRPKSFYEQRKGRTVNVSPRYHDNVIVNRAAPLAEVCSVLPRLHCLVIQECLNMSCEGIDGLEKQVLPRITELELNGTTEDMVGRCGSLEEIAWTQFFEHIPDNLQRLSMARMGKKYQLFLELLVRRLERGLGKLRALHLGFDFWSDPTIKREQVEQQALLQRILDLLNNQLTEFTVRRQALSERIRVCLQICCTGVQMMDSMANWSEMTALRKLHLYMDNMKNAYRDLRNLGRMCNLRELHIVCYWMVYGEETCAALSHHPGLEVLVLPLDTRKPKILDHIALPNLRTLRFVPANFPSLLGAQLMLGLVGLVGRCPRLDVLSVIQTWKISEFQDWWLTVELLCQMEIALLHSRAAPSDSQPESEGQGSSSSVLHQPHTPPTDSQSLPDSMGVPHESSEVGISLLTLQAAPSDSQPLPGCSTKPEKCSAQEKMEVAAQEMLREREKYRGGGDMVRPLLLELGRTENKGDQENNCILVEKYIYSAFTEKSPVLRVSIEKSSAT